MDINDTTVNDFTSNQIIEKIDMEGLPVNGSDIIHGNMEQNYRMEGTQNVEENDFGSNVGVPLRLDNTSTVNYDNVNVDCSFQGFQRNNSVMNNRRSPTDNDEGMQFRLGWKYVLKLEDDKFLRPYLSTQHRFCLDLYNMCQHVSAPHYFFGEMKSLMEKYSLFNNSLFRSIPCRRTFVQSMQ